MTVASGEYSREVAVKNSDTPVARAVQDAAAHYHRVIAETQNTQVVSRNPDVKRRRVSGMPRWAGEGAL